MHRPARAALVGSLLVSAAAGCQWVLPIHEVDANEAGVVGERDADALDGDAGSIATDGGAARDAPVRDAQDGAVLVGDAPAGDAPPCNVSAGKAPACNDCMNQYCCPQLTECLVTNPECFALGACLASCFFDPQCQQACVLQHADGGADFDSLNSCGTIRCGVPCSPGDGG